MTKTSTLKLRDILESLPIIDGKRAARPKELARHIGKSYDSILWAMKNGKCDTIKNKFAGTLVDADSYLTFLGGEK
jgi:hypothetical protein